MKLRALQELFWACSMSVGVEQSQVLEVQRRCHSTTCLLCEDERSEPYNQVNTARCFGGIRLQGALVRIVTEELKEYVANHMI
jgi:hypothetical protein